MVAVRKREVHGTMSKQSQPQATASHHLSGANSGAGLLLTLIFLLGIAQMFVHVPGAAAASPFTFQTVIDEAKELSKAPFKTTKGEVPDSLLKITYDEWRDIRFKPEKALWRQEKLPFTVQFFHPGLYFDHTVSVNIVDPDGTVRPVPFSTDLFDYKSERVKSLVPGNLGFAGFRIHSFINTKDYQDEVVVFLGASYFRAVGRHMNYGLSARALAINTWLPEGEEFPFFRKFWIYLPSSEAKDITICALLDSPSLAGAYQFLVIPGKETVMDVKSTIYLRKKVEKLGVAPMTSMFFYGENTSVRPVDDFRPEVHDSDGLMVNTGYGEWIWRPLVNPKSLLITSFQMSNPKGFGLCQRDQNFEHYQDLEGNYENRPSLWISPVGNWGEGRVELIQAPTEKEIFDNVVAFWVPSTLPEIGEPLTFDYRMSWHYFSDGGRPPAGLVVATYTAKGKAEGTRKFVVDFQGGQLESLAPDAPLEGIVTVGPNAKVVEQQLYKNRFMGGWRLAFQVTMEKEGEEGKQNVREPLELRAFLRLKENILSETWSYVYQP
jgi:glucans biosynthesis protein